MGSTSNEVFNAIEYEIGCALHEGSPLPPEFSITFTEQEFVALLAGGVRDNGAPVPTTTRALRFEVHGHFVTVLRGEEPEPWSLHS